MYALQAAWTLHLIWQMLRRQAFHVYLNFHYDVRHQMRKMALLSRVTRNQSLEN